MTVGLSIVIPTYNRSGVVAAAVDSALKQQPYREVAFEIIVVDDASSDALDAVLHPFGERIRVVRHAANSGTAAARNSGIEAAAGEYIAFLDSDDVWLPGKLTQQLEVMDRHGWNASCTAYVLAEAGARDVVAPHLPTQALGVKDLVWGCVVSPGSTLLCRKSLFAQIGPFDTSLRRLEDWDWLLRLVQIEPLGFLAQPLARINPSGTGAASTVIPVTDRLWEKHASKLRPAMRRRFASALDIERAASHYRDGEYVTASLLLGRSFLRAPVGNARVANVIKKQCARLLPWWQQ
jgi:glycosyltransferase involved in cell wall biosynthesis